MFIAEDDAVDNPDRGDNAPWTDTEWLDGLVLTLNPKDNQGLRERFVHIYADRGRGVWERSGALDWLRQATGVKA